jgi:drug/metabolite transporter (DMT)-like permease
MSGSRDRWGILLGIVGVVLFGGTLPATRLAVGYFDPLFLTAVRASVAGCVGLTVLVLLRRPIPLPKFWLGLVGAGICTIVGFPVFMALAMAHVPAAHGGVVLGIVPLATVAAAALVAGERPSLGFWLASASGAVVVIAFVLRGHRSSGFAHKRNAPSGGVMLGALGGCCKVRNAVRLPRVG